MIVIKEGFNYWPHKVDGWHRSTLPCANDKKGKSKNCPIDETGAGTYMCHVCGAVFEFNGVTETVKSSKHEYRNL